MIDHATGSQLSLGMTCVTSKLIVVAGLRRSGLHACVRWLIPHFPGRVRLINDPFLPERPKPDGFQRMASDFDVIGGRVRVAATPAVLAAYRRESNLLTAKSLPRPWRSLAGWFLARWWNAWQARLPVAAGLPVANLDEEIPETIILLLENITVADLRAGIDAHLQAYLHWMAKNCQVTVQPFPTPIPLVLVLRSPWNNLASLLKNPDVWGPIQYRLVAPEQLMPAWIDQARIVCGEDTSLSGGRWQPIPFIYDRWFAEVEYRQRVAAELGVPHTDAGLQQVMNFGGGSSFEGTGTEGKAQGMRVLDRWRHYEQHPLMRAMFASGEVRSLARSAFGEAAVEAALAGRS